MREPVVVSLCTPPQTTTGSTTPFRHGRLRMFFRRLHDGWRKQLTSHHGRWRGPGTSSTTGGGAPGTSNRRQRSDVLPFDCSLPTAGMWLFSVSARHSPAVPAAPLQLRADDRENLRRTTATWQRGTLHTTTKMAGCGERGESHGEAGSPGAFRRVHPQQRAGARLMTPVRRCRSLPPKTSPPPLVVVLLEPDVPTDGITATFPSSFSPSTEAFGPQYPLPHGGATFSTTPRPPMSQLSDLLHAMAIVAAILRPTARHDLFDLLHAHHGHRRRGSLALMPATARDVALLRLHGAWKMTDSVPPFYALDRRDRRCGALSSRHTQ